MDGEAKNRLFIEPSSENKLFEDLEKTECLIWISKKLTEPKEEIERLNKLISEKDEWIKFWEDQYNRKCKIINNAIKYVENSDKYDFSKCELLCKLNENINK